MIYYKVILDDTVIDAVTEQNCCKYMERSRTVLLCSAQDNPQGISSQRMGRYYQVEGWPTFPEDVTESGGMVALKEIEQFEYETICASLDAGDDPEDDNPVVPGNTDESKVMTRAELTAAVNQLTANQAALTAAIEKGLML